MKWKSEWNDRSFRVHVIATFPVLVVTLYGLTSFLATVEARPGVVLPDPALRWFSPYDLTWLTFALIYAGLGIGVLHLSHYPRSMVLAVQAYILMALVRIVAMYLVPLDPPVLLIPLKDPLVEFFGDGQVLTRDLFFSGHTSTMFLLFLTATDRLLKGSFLALTALVAVCVVLQHVHYVVDVLVAPFIVYGCYRIVARIHGTVRV